MNSLVSIGAGVALALALAGCATAPAGGGGGAAVLANAAGQNVAWASLRQTGSGIRVRVEASALAPGVYGIHLHSVGRCELPSFASAGPHWNPAGRRHGRDNPQGMHMGDLLNLTVGANGRGVLDSLVPNSSLSGPGANPLLDADGAAIVIHEKADDYRTDPSGNSGTRMACGVIAAGR